MNQPRLIDVKVGKIVEPMTKDEARTTTTKIKQGVKEIESLLLEIYEREGWKSLGYKSMNQYMLEEFPEFSSGHLHHKLQAAKTRRNLAMLSVDSNLPESVLRPIATNEYIKQPERQRDIIETAVAISGHNQPTTADVEQAKQLHKEKPKSQKNDRPTFNSTNENIEWAAWSWNPVTGCLHGCEYCYARDIANRFYPQKFKPTYYPERLAAPENTKLPKPRWDSDFGYKGVFVCSMADLFGEWVPQEWIESVLQSINNNPQWTFLLLTKFPIRMADFSYPPNVWLGTTVDKQWVVDRAEKGFTKIKESGFGGVCWLSCEPMMECLTFSSLEMFDWVVMGGASKSSQTPEYRPPFPDIVHLHNQAKSHDLPIYQKTNLIPGMSDEQRLREYPKGVTNEPAD